MATLIDTSVWIDFTRAATPQKLKQFIAPHILDPDAHLAEPILFEVLRHATPSESRLLRQQFATFPVLPTPPDVWMAAADLGQRCRKLGFTVASLDLLIASIAIAHQAILITFDADFQSISRACGLQVNLLRRP